MQEAWIQLQCPGCDKRWEANPAELPAPDGSYTCEDCDATRRVSEFPKTARDFEILESFGEV